MDERAFIEHRRDLWNRISRSLEIATKRRAEGAGPESLEALAADYRAVVSDLASARAQDASDNLIAYLNELSGRAHGVLYSGRGARIGGLGCSCFAIFRKFFARHSDLR